jgi:flagellar operon protein
MGDDITLSINAVQGISPDLGRSTVTTPVQGEEQGQAFEDVLKTELGRPLEVRFSSHAQRRIQARSIEFDKEAAVRLEEAVDKAASKGAKESLILMDDLAFVVSIQNRTVITAVDAESRKENVFTNIDSVVLT